MSRSRLNILVEQLAQFRTHLSEVHGNRHSFRRTSASQSNRAYEKFKTGKSLSHAEWVATYFAIMQHVRQFQASVFVASCVMRSFIETIEGAHSRGDLISLLGQLRSLMERIAHLHFLTKRVYAKLQVAQESYDVHPLLSSLNIDDDMRNALYGTTVKWNEVAAKPLEAIDLEKELGKRLKEDFGIHFATQILNKIDALNKSVPGTRAAYEILCDYLHPNVGDLFAVTSSYVEDTDRFGVKHLIRDIYVGQRSFDGTTADRVILDRIYDLFAKLIEISADDYRRCKLLDATLSDWARSYTKEILKNNKHTFKKSDLCPCSSGKRVFACCGRGLLWKG
jgi:hypothetical protein